VTKALAAVVLVAAVLAAGPAHAAPATTGRLAGATRYDTAVAISKATFPSTVSDVVIARGDLYPDALVASFLASLANGNSPVLLTEPTRLPAAVATELRRLHPSRAYVMGDAAAVSAQVVASIKAIVPDVQRVAGATRYDTAAAVAAMVGGTRDVAFVVSGENYADALSVAPLSNRGVPVVLTTGASLHPAARRALEALHTARVYVVGGSSAVSDAVIDQLAAMDISVARVSGPNRYATATAVADLALTPEFGVPLTHVNLARGDGFADAVAGGPHGGAEGAPTLFVAGRDDLGEATRDWLRAHAPAITSLHALGEAGVISDAVLADAAQAAD
jgi:putative cell wall-binding protein